MPGGFGPNGTGKAPGRPGPDIAQVLSMINASASLIDDVSPAIFSSLAQKVERINVLPH
jgi:hypothetical protein